MQQVIERLAQRKRGKGFISLFYGAPGTGKTEICYFLQEFEKMEGIVICTTNLAGNYSHFILLDNILKTIDGV